MAKPTGLLLKQLLVHSQLNTMTDSKLIILRGLSGSGKSSIARELQKRSKQNTIIVEQDYFRNTLLQEKGDARKASAEMLEQTVLIGLKHGYNVVLEGILNIKHYKELFDKIFSAHPQNNFIYFLDVDIDETIKRHKARTKSAEFDENEMRSWAASATPAGYEFEIIHNNMTSIDAATQQILLDTSL